MVDTTKLNGQKYNYEYFIYNDSGSVNIQDNSVNMLMLVDEYTSPWQDGSITISNPFDIIEKDYVFKGDGSDRIRILLENVETKEKIGGLFTIIGEENATDDSSPALNRKTFHFVDTDESLLLHEFPYGHAYCGLTGVILEEVLKNIGIRNVAGLKEEPGDNVFTNFDPYVPSVNHRYIDVVYYLLRHYYKIIDKNLVSKGFLRKDSLTGQYEFELLHKVFLSNSKRTKEVLHAGEVVNQGDLRFNKNNYPSTSKQEYALFQNNVTSISFDNVNVDISNEYLMNSRVVTYDPMIGRHRSTQVKLKDVEAEWKKYYVDVFSAVGGSAKPHFNKGGPGNKTGSQWKTFRLPFQHDQNVRLIWGNMSGDLVFRNNQINIATNGNAQRRAGWFIDLNKVKDEDVLIDSKHLGRWFMTRVEHYKLGATYRNNINAVKTYVGPVYPKRT